MHPVKALRQFQCWELNCLYWAALILLYAPAQGCAVLGVRLDTELMTSIFFKIRLYVFMLSTLKQKLFVDELARPSLHLFAGL